MPQKYPGDLSIASTRLSATAWSVLRRADPSSPHLCPWNRDAASLVFPFSESLWSGTCNRAWLRDMPSPCSVGCRCGSRSSRHSGVSPSHTTRSVSRELVGSGRKWMQGQDCNSTGQKPQSESSSCFSVRTGTDNIFILANLLPKNIYNIYFIPG